MSSLRNAVQRRNHRERAQPEARRKWGLLEKHKDYSLRAKDYNAKKAQLKRLREKARDRNPDEFAFGMVSAKSSKQGRHGARDPNATLSHEAVKLLKTQDAGYLRTVGEKIRRRLVQLEAEAKLQEGMQKALQAESGIDTAVLQHKSKRVFVDDEREITEEDGEDAYSDEGDFMSDGEADSGDAAAGYDFSAPPRQTPDEPKQTLTKKQQERLEQAQKDQIARRRAKKRTQESRLRQIEVLRKQLQDIKAAEDELDLQRAKMSNSVGGVNKNGVKWKVRERKR
ncbi:hypothetical protein KEM52_001589 [Ascosphaera acerosa]|nr:hypothetical protein KEM52_001589 [Ascosphaera acerosa]